MVQLRHLNRNGFKLMRFLGQVNAKTKRVKKPLTWEEKIDIELKHSREYKNLSGSKANQLAGLSKCTNCSIRHQCSEVLSKGYKVSPRTCKRTKRYVRNRLLLDAVVNEIYKKGR